MGIKHRVDKDSKNELSVSEKLRVLTSHKIKSKKTDWKKIKMEHLSSKYGN